MALELHAQITKWTFKTRRWQRHNELNIAIWVPQTTKHSLHLQPHQAADFLNLYIKDY